MSSDEEGRPAQEVAERGPRIKGKVRADAWRGVHEHGDASRELLAGLHSSMPPSPHTPPTHAAQHRKDKPWDHEGINHWEITPFKKEDNPGGVLEESSFSTLFPKYRGESAGGVCGGLARAWPAGTGRPARRGVQVEWNCGHFAPMTRRSPARPGRHGRELSEGGVERGDQGPKGARHRLHPEPCGRQHVGAHDAQDVRPLHHHEGP